MPTEIVARAVPVPPNPFSQTDHLPDQLTVREGLELLVGLRHAASVPTCRHPATGLLRTAKVGARRDGLVGSPSVAGWADTGVVRGEDGRSRCGWCVGAPDYQAYHDDEWGRPVTDDVRLFEKISLEGFQSGLSWLTILRKREAFRRAFAGFSPEMVAEFGPADVERLLADPGIVRHRGKIDATIANARATLEAQRRHGSLAAVVWSFEPPRRTRRAPRRLGDLPTTTPESVALSRTLRGLGFRYVGATTAYAAMESLGLVNDNLAGCHVRAECEAERRAITRADARDS